MIRIDKLNEDLSNIDDILKPARKDLKEAKKDISLDSKNIAVANVEQPSLMAYYDQTKVELKFLTEYAEVLLKKKKGELFKEILESYSKSLNDRAIDKLIDSDPTYVELYRTYLEIKELYEKYIAIVNGFSQRSYSLTNLVKVYEKELQDIKVYE